MERACRWSPLRRANIRLRQSGQGIGVIECSGLQERFGVRWLRGERRWMLLSPYWDERGIVVVRSVGR